MPTIFIASGHTQRWRFTWREGEWRGNTINPPRPLNGRTRLTYAVGSQSFHGNQECSVLWSVTNRGPEPDFFKVEPTTY